MSDHFSFDAYTPAEIARRIETVGVTKARMPLLPLLLLGVMAGAFIGLGALFSFIVRSDATLGPAASAVGGGLVFALGLLLVVVAGAELFTGNNLLAMAWADGRISTHELLRNWFWVCLANLVGAAGLALLVFLSGHAQANGGAVGAAVLKSALAKQALPWEQAFVRGLLCNVLVCMAVWMAMAGRSVVDKFVAIVLPIAAFVAAGFEHSIANMYIFPLAWLLQHFSLPNLTLPPVEIAQTASNLLAVIAGNLVGGSLLVGLTYHVIYQRKPET
ncbi:formate/nitrite transporter family protein [Curvibacter sp. APW13]|uniref:formate/nitrite transporter family protein n=1 Tax=Curvibacter sp. APW13 TaxID=3077236 RepID=UPI0028DF1A42|nr:formate/nitrite transporter family protein [Curvibacter sp. APW13]MDT8990410.1 formate/nitrite transporter family protein [Curvibacter sp. APW13]